MDAGSRYILGLWNTHFTEKFFVNVEVTSNHVDSGIKYKWGTNTSASRRFKLEVVNIENLQHLFEIEI